jgi:serine/threonine protein kinase
MPLTPGVRLGRYEILSPLGAGGMGEVWRARDSELSRDVAIKTLSSAFWTDAERLRRLEREARAVSALNHPNILTVYDVGSVEGAPYLVTELLHGETLQARLRRGRLAFHEILDCGVQIATGLAAAHDAGIVHRDLKPANLFLCVDGRVRILDFGLAKRVETPVAEASEATTLSWATGSEALLGTPGYMSPEQLRGEAVDSRSDVFSFGAVLLEMDTGRRAFGSSAADAIAAILRGEPDWSASGEGATSPTFERIVKRCLETKPSRRFQSMHDLAFALENLTSPSDERQTMAPARLAMPPVTTRSVLPLPDGACLSGEAAPVLAISRDGTKVAFVARDETGSSVYVVQLDRGEMRSIPGSENASSPFFSHDGGWVAFATDIAPGSTRPAEMRKHSFATGLTQTVRPISDFEGGDWSEQGDIYFVETAAKGLRRVRSVGGDDEAAVPTYRVGTVVGPRCVGWPRLLHGRGSALVIDWDASALGDASVLDLDTGELRALDGAGSVARALATGHLLFTRTDGVLFAAPWDVRGARLTAAPTAVVKDVALDTAGGVFAVSENGTLVYARGSLRGSIFEPKRLVLLDPDGRERWASPAIEALAASPVLSPDGNTVAVSSRIHGIWIFDLERGTRRRLPLGRARLARSPVWTHDGSRVVFRAAWVGEMGYRVLHQPADGGGDPEQLFDAGGIETRPCGLSPDGSLLFERPAPRGGYEVWELPAHGGPTRRVVPGPLEGTSVAPNGRWVAYRSGDSGSVEVFVRRLADRAGAIQISTNGGSQARWSRDGRELYYLSGDSLLAVTFTERDGQAVTGTPRRVFERQGVDGFAVLAEGRGFVTVEPVPGTGWVREIQIVTNWFPELLGLAPNPSS